MLDKPFSLLNVEVRIMSRQVVDFSRGALWSVAAVLLAATAFAGPMEEARALYNAGKYGEVDNKLGPLLDRRPVPMEVQTSSTGNVLRTFSMSSGP